MAMWHLVGGGLMTLPYDVPVTPDPEQARQWATDELAKEVYHHKESLWNILAEKLAEFFQRVTDLGSDNSLLGLLAIVAALLAVAGVIIYSVYHAGRLTRSVGERDSSAVFEEDLRSAQAMRDSAQRAAADGDYSLAVVERFRAIARSLQDRTILEDYPGRTAREVCSDATPRLPEFTEDLRWAADHFDLLCYSEAVGSAQDYARMTNLDIAIGTAKPVSVPGAIIEPTMAAPS